MRVRDETEAAGEGEGEGQTEGANRYLWISFVLEATSNRFVLFQKDQSSMVLGSQNRTVEYHMLFKHVSFPNGGNSKQITWGLRSQHLG